jgi:hypothetical protein
LNCTDVHLRCSVRCNIGEFLQTENVSEGAGLQMSARVSASSKLCCRLSKMQDLLLFGYWAGNGCRLQFGEPTGQLISSGFGFSRQLFPKCCFLRLSFCTFLGMHAGRFRFCSGLAVPLTAPLPVRLLIFRFRQPVLQSHRLASVVVEMDQT